MEFMLLFWVKVKLQQCFVTVKSRSNLQWKMFHEIAPASDTVINVVNAKHEEGMRTKHEIPLKRLPQICPQFREQLRDGSELL